MPGRRASPLAGPRPVVLPTEARALWWTGPRQGELRAERLPAPGPYDLVVRALASGISAGTELLVYRGQVPADLPLDLPTLAGSFAYPIKYGYASVGRVLSAGVGVPDIAPGTLVFALHPHQDYYVVPADNVIPLPPAIAPTEAVFLANLETAVNVVLDATPRLGETVLLSGLGVVGLLVLQLLLRAGVAEVLVVDPLAPRRALARRLGAALALAPGDDLAAEVRARTAGRGADLAIEASGAPAALGPAIEALADEGTAVVVSWYGTKPVSLPLGGHFHRGRLRLISSQVGHVAPALAPRWSYARRRQVALDLLPTLALQELISDRVPFAEAPTAYARLDLRPETAVQLVLTYD